MAFASLHWQYLITILIFCQCGESLRIDVKTGTFNGWMTNEINVTCRLDDDLSHWSKEIVVMKIEKEGQGAIAILRQHKLESGVDRRNSMEISGQIEKDSSQSFLRLTIKDPQIEDTGTYECEIFYLNELGKFYVQSAHANVTINDRDTTSFLNFLSEKISALEKTIQTQGSVISNQTKVIQNQNNLLRDQEKQLDEQQNHTNNYVRDTQAALGYLQDQVSDLKETAKQQTDKILAMETILKDQENLSRSQNNSLMKCRNELDVQMEQLQEMQYYLKLLDEKDSFMSAFSVGLKNAGMGGTFLGRETMLFEEKIMMVGKAYNLKTGVFTAPRHGYYVFHLFVTCSANAYLQIDLMANNKVLATLQVRDRNYLGQSSVSTVVALGAGDEVKPVRKNSISKHHVDSTDQLSVFTGYLLKLL